MGNSSFFGGRVHNKSSSALIVVYNDPSNPVLWRHSALNAGDSTPMLLDVDGFRAVEQGRLITLHQTIADDIGWAGWWKIKDWTTATVRENTPGLRFWIDIGVPFKREPECKSDADFGYDPGSTTLQPFP